MHISRCYHIYQYDNYYHRYHRDIYRRHQKEWQEYVVNYEKYFFLIQHISYNEIWYTLLFEIGTNKPSLICFDIMWYILIPNKVICLRAPIKCRPFLCLVFFPLGRNIKGYKKCKWKNGYMQYIGKIRVF